MNKQKGNISIIVLIIIILLGGGYFLISNNEKDVSSTSIIPKECQASQDDVCELFSCMTSNCWCEESPLGGVIYQEVITVKNEADAKKIVNNYLTSIDSKLNQKIEVFKINEIFFNVFVEDDNGDENAFTVSIDGKILITVCGI